MMQLANSTFYMSGAEARLSPHSNGSRGSPSSNVSGPATATVHKLRKSEASPRRTSSRASVGGTVVATRTQTTNGTTEEEVSPDELAGQSSSSAPISPTLSPSSRLMLKRKQINASLALRSPPFCTSSSACSTSSSAASSLVSFSGGSSSKSNSLKRMSPEEENLASRLRNLQISELIDAILLVEGKLKKEQKMIARELRSRDLQISQQLKEIERYREERKQNLCGFCQKKMDNVASCGGGEKQLQQQQQQQVMNNWTGDRVTKRRSVEVQTEEVTGFRGNVVEHGKRTENVRDEEIVDDWYANGNSDNENEKSPVNFYERGVNPVLERVNQILLQESTDDAEAAMAAAGSVPHATQRQHSAQHQQVKLAERMQTTRIPEIRKSAPPIGKCAPIVMKRPLLPPTTTTATSVPVHPPMLMRVHSSPVSLRGGKENEYEVIGSEQDSSNYYMDMQSPVDVHHQPPQFGKRSATAADEVQYNNVLSRKEGLELLKLIAPHPGMPPALPPKPANLMKFKKVVPTPPTRNGLRASAISLGKPTAALEPDYCSISECGANNNSGSSVMNQKQQSRMNGAGEVADDDIEETASKASEDTLENIPKLPNVAAIIVPKKQQILQQINAQSAQSQQQQQKSQQETPAGNGDNVQNIVTGGSNNSKNVAINKDNYITKSVMSLKSSPPAEPPLVMPVMGSPKAKDLMVTPTKDLPPLLGGDSKRFPHSPMRGGNGSLVERRQNLMHRLSVQHTHHGMMMKRYSMDALSPQIQAEEVKGAGGAFEERIPIQAEFDWYNLDAEFGKFNAQDVIKEAKSSGSESGSVSGGDEEKLPTAKLALDRGLGELREIERKMSTLERKRGIEKQQQRKDGADKEMVHFC